MNQYQVTCKNCGHILVWDDMYKVYVCTYCGEFCNDAGKPLPKQIQKKVLM